MLVDSRVEFIQIIIRKTARISQLSKSSFAFTCKKDCVNNVHQSECMRVCLNLYICFTLRSEIDFFCLFKYGGVKAEAGLSRVQSMFKSITRTAQFTASLQAAVNGFPLFRYVFSRKYSSGLNDARVCCSLFGPECMLAAFTRAGVVDLGGAGPELALLLPSVAT